MDFLLRLQNPGMPSFQKIVRKEKCMFQMVSRERFISIKIKRETRQNRRILASPRPSNRLISVIN